MIYLSATQSEKVIIQNNRSVLSGVSVGDESSYYTFKIESCDSFKEYVFSPVNGSESPYYDSFTLSVGSPSVATGSVVLNIEAGQYNYEVYKMPTQYNLNIASASYVVSRGIFQVIGTSSVYTSPVPISFTQSDADTIKVFTEL
jgi:hypothetical protein